jgi:hypothetical protein
VFSILDGNQNQRTGGLIEHTGVSLGTFDYLGYEVLSDIF